MAVVRVPNESPAWRDRGSTKCTHVRRHTGAVTAVSAVVAFNDALHWRPPGTVVTDRGIVYVIVGITPIVLRHRDRRRNRGIRSIRAPNGTDNVDDAWVSSLARWPCIKNITPMARGKGSLRSPWSLD